MEFRELELFVEVVRAESFTRAAARQFVSQPAVSLAVRRLEEELGRPLVERRRSGVRVTPAGQVLYDRATELLRAREEARSAVRGSEGLEPQGELRLGTTDAVSAYLFPAVFREFRRRFPKVTLRVRVDSTHVLARAVVERALDVAVLNLPAPVDGLVTTPVVEEALVMVAAPAHPAASSRRGRRALLRESAFIAYPARSVTRRVIDEAFRRADFEPRVEMEMGSPDAMRQLVVVGIGVSVLPRPLVEADIERGRLVELGLSRFRARRTLGFATAASGGGSAAADAFIEVTDAEFAARANRG